MRINLKKIILFLFIVLIISMPVLAQRTGSASGGSSPAPSKPTLTVRSNVSGARVEITTVYYKDGAVASGTAPFSAQLDRGTYIVTVSAPGYDSQQQTVNLSSSQTITVNLGASTAALQIMSNVRDARVVITGSSLNGQLIGSAPFTAQLERGSYRITVSADGYRAASRDINLNGAQTISINLDQDTYNLIVTSNVDGAKVFIKGGSINGQLTGTTDMSVTLPGGRYQIKVNAPHYFAEEQNITLSESTTMNIQLRPRTARADIIIPNNILDYTIGNPAAQIKIFDNGTKVNGTSLELTPGQHTIRVTSGGLASQQTINVEAGDSYRIEVNFGFTLIKE